MAEVIRTERKVDTTETRYTLGLSADEMSEVIEALYSFDTAKSEDLVTVLENARKPTPEKPSVGDQVRVIEDDPHELPGEFVGLVGTLVDTDPSSILPFLVRFPSSARAPHYEWYCTRVEKVGAGTS